MHLPVRETRLLDDADLPQSLEHGPADIVFLSFSDTDLGLIADAWRNLPRPRPRLRLANAGQLKHAMSVDLYVDDTIRHARCVVLRLIGGADFWRYGVEQVSTCCRRHGIALAIISGATGDERLEQASTASIDNVRALDSYLRESGSRNAQAALHVAMDLAGIPAPPAEPLQPMPPFGVHDFTSPTAVKTDAALVFYRSHLVAGDIAPLEALATQLANRGIHARGIFLNSLKDPDAALFVASKLGEWRPSLVLTSLGFSARTAEAAASPLDVANTPALQLILGGTTREAWETSSRGLSASDLAMQIALPEVDGRLSTTAISFKAPQAFDPELCFSRIVHTPDANQISTIADQAAGWVNLASKARADRKIAIVLSDYPAIGGQIGHAIGLDTFASLHVIAGTLNEAGYRCDTTALNPLNGNANGRISLLDYATANECLADRINAAWGDASADEQIRHNGFAFRIARSGNIIAAIQPDRGLRLDRQATYHDPSSPPCHTYAAFYAWLTHLEKVDAIIHLGAHGTLEWLPGKAAAPAADDFATVMLRGTPLIYPFIVNNPGEAAPAKRRLGAVLIGHMTPPLKEAGAHKALAELEQQLEEYAAADGMDRRRAERLRQDIVASALSSGLAAEAGVSNAHDAPEALSRLDAYLCDVKELQIRDGLHVFGSDATLHTQAEAIDDPIAQSRMQASPQRERKALLDALDGKFVEPGPSGAPSRGRPDVYPTGRNMHGVDPRSIPTRTTMALAEKTAADILLRHLQENGDHLRATLFDIWGGPTLRTGGEDLALAFWLMGVKPIWDFASNRVTGIEVIPMARLQRPRVDVTLRVSGLFRDAFPAQIELFDLAVRTLARLRESNDDNPFTTAAELEAEDFQRATTRVFGSPPGDYGAGVTELIATGRWRNPSDLGAAWLAASAFSYGAGREGRADIEGLKARVFQAQAMVHVQDHGEIDLLDSLDFPAHEGGFAAAAASLGNQPSVYHADTSKPDRARIRRVEEEIARITRARASNPEWIAGMMRHGYRGAAEIARSLDSLFAFAASLPTRFDRQFDLLFDATLGSPDVDDFIATNNRAAHETMTSRFEDAMQRGLWRPRRNDIPECLRPSGGASTSA
ncbi:MAG: cobaltochelatase subunit CobN [Burkholderiales bacterium]|nr:MAG: cobaltochelatase subunit CobN [Burkholderiales bacterium]